MAAAAARLLLGLLLQAARVLDLLLLCLNGTQEQGVMGRPIKASLFSRTQFDPSLGDVSSWPGPDATVVKLLKIGHPCPQNPKIFLASQGRTVTGAVCCA